MSDVSQTRVVHIRHHPYDVYIGRANPRSRLRASPFANPFRIGPDGTREEVMEKYETLMRERLASDNLWRERLEALRGRTLGCWCAPEPCHGDVLVRLLDEQQEDEESEGTMGD